MLRVQDGGASATWWVHGTVSVALTGSGVANLNTAASTTLLSTYIPPPLVNIHNTLNSIHFAGNWPHHLRGKRFHVAMLSKFTMLFVSGVQLSSHLHFQTAGRYRIFHKCPNPSFCQSRPQKQRSHHTTSPLSSTLALLVTEVHWASLEWSKTQPQHNCQVAPLSGHVLSSSRECQETQRVCC